MTKAHLETLNNAPVVPGQVHDGVPADLAMTQPVPCVLLDKLGPGEQCLDLGVKVPWDGNAAVLG